MTANTSVSPWASGGNMNTQRQENCGLSGTIQNHFVWWNGSAWTEVADLNNGTSWTEGNNLGTATWDISGAGWWL